MTSRRDRAETRRGGSNFARSRNPFQKVRRPSRRFETRRVDIGDRVDRSHSATTRIPGSNQYQPLDFSRVHFDELREFVDAKIQELVEANAIDDWTPDVLDAVLEARCTVCHAELKAEYRARLQLSLELLANTRHALSDAHEDLRIMRERAEVSYCNFDAWRKVLTGEKNTVQILSGAPDVASQTRADIEMSSVSFETDLAQFLEIFDEMSGASRY